MKINIIYFFLLALDFLVLFMIHTSKIYIRNNKNIKIRLKYFFRFNKIKNKIRKAIKTNAINQREWENFEKNLVQSHEEFVQKLTKSFSELTPKDIKLAIYLRMNLSSKEIAPLMNISYRGVELHRYRLRKKIQLPSEESLSRFMINF